MPRSFLREHAALVSFLVVASIVAAITYELTGGGKPRAFLTLDPRLDTLDLRGDRPTELWTDESFECLGWRATFNCDPHGQRDVTRDRACDQPLTRTSGYCEVRNRTSGQILRLMLATRASWQWWLVPTLTCNDARAFSDFSIRAARYHHAEPLGSPPPVTIKATSTKPTALSYERGVVMIGYPKVIAGVYAIVRMLRHHGCALPVEVWIDPLEMRESHSVLQELTNSYNVIVRTILDPLATKFFTKPYALYHSHFDQVLLLDSDNIPAKDPTYLFDSPEFVKFGALFWPDFWRPEPTTPFNVQQQSALWQLLDMPFTDMYEQESGQVLVDRKKAKRALNKLMFYSTQMPRLLTDLQLVYGDKDLFRLAWLNTTTPFYYVPHLVALGGLYDAEEDFFCGISMVQRDPSGEIIFMHRNQAKLDGRRDQKPAITHLQKFIGGNGDSTSLRRDLDKYRVACKTFLLGRHNCFFLKPKTPDGSNTPHLIQSLASTKYPASEKQAIHYSIEGRHFLTKDEEAELVELERKEDAKIQAEEEETIGYRRRSARNDEIWRIVILVAVLTVLVLCIRPLDWWWWRRRRAALPRSSPTNKAVESVASAISVTIAAAATKVRSLSSSSSSSSVGGFGPSAAAPSGPAEASWRRKKSFALAGEDQHIL